MWEGRITQGAVIEMAENADNAGAIICPRHFYISFSPRTPGKTIKSISHGGTEYTEKINTLIKRVFETCKILQHFPIKISS
jgi:hypothetical protein